MNDWTCPVCGLETEADSERDAHMKEATNDPAHAELVKEKAKNVLHETKDKVADVADDVAGKIKSALD